jgi:5-methylcytosine-specific restriction endonuclease McrA
VAVYRGRCRSHARGREQEIRRPGRALYRTKRWAITRDRVLAERPICEVCHDALAEHCHHIKDIGDGGDPWARDNLQACCSTCHGRITRRSQL